MNNILRLNVPALSKSLSISGLDVREYTSGLSYIDDTRIVYKASSDNTVYRICKDYQVNGASFALNLIITDTNIGKAEEYLDKVAKTIAEEQLKSLNSPYQWVDSVYEVKK